MRQGEREHPTPLGPTSQRLRLYPTDRCFSQIVSDPFFFDFQSLDISRLGWQLGYSLTPDAAGSSVVKRNLRQRRQRGDPYEGAIGHLRPEQPSAVAVSLREA